MGTPPPSKERISSFVNGVGPGDHADRHDRGFLETVHRLDDTGGDVVRIGANFLVRGMNQDALGDDGNEKGVDEIGLQDGFHDPFEHLVVCHGGQVQQRVRFHHGRHDGPQGGKGLIVERSQLEIAQVVRRAGLFVSGVGDDGHPVAMYRKVVEQGKGFNEVSVVDHGVGDDGAGLFHGGPCHCILAGDGGGVRRGGLLAGRRCDPPCRRSPVSCCLPPHRRTFVRPWV